MFAFRSFKRVIAKPKSKQIRRRSQRLARLPSGNRALESLGILLIHTSHVCTGANGHSSVLQMKKLTSWALFFRLLQLLG